MSLAWPAPAQPKYTVHDLGTLGGSSSLALAINSSGQVVGQSVTAGGQSHAFRTAPNGAINPATDDLGTLGGLVSRATAINDFGQVAGSSSVSGFFDPHPFRTAPNSVINPATDDLGTLGGPPPTVATGISSTGQVVGYSAVGVPNRVRAFRTAANRPINLATDDLGSLFPPSVNGFIIEANGINSLGQVAGSSTDANLVPHAFRTAPNSAINPATDDLGNLGGSPGPFSATFASGINSSGQVVGQSTTASGQAHAFRTAPNSAINPATDDLGALGGGFSSAAGINGSGQVVGSSSTASFQMHAFLYSGGVMYDLNNLIPPNSGWALESASGINDLAQIAGYGVVNGVQHAFRLDLDPLSRPSRAHEITATLLAMVGSYNLPATATADFSSVLRAAMDAMQNGEYLAARNQLAAFENMLRAQRGKWLTAAQSNTLLNLAATAIQLLS